MSQSPAEAEDIEKLYSNMDLCIAGIKMCIKKKSLFEGGKKREQRFSVIESFFRLILNTVTKHPEVRSLCFEETYISLFTEFVIKRKNYPPEIIKMIFEILQVCSYDSLAVSQYTALCQSQNLTTVFWIDGFLSTVFQCYTDEYYGTVALQSLYYMLYNNDCFKQFKTEGCIPDLIMLAEGHSEDKRVDSTIVSIANEILNKIMLEGKEDALLTLSPYELLLLTSSNNNTARMTSLVLISDVLDTASLLPYSLSKCRDDSIDSSCCFEYMNEVTMDCVAVFIKNQYLFIYSMDEDNKVNETPNYKIGLDNVYLSIGTKERGPQQYRFTFYLPGGNSFSLRLRSERLFDNWKEKLSLFPSYNAETYPYRYPVTYTPPYYNMKYSVTEETAGLPLNDLLLQVQSILSNTIIIPEMYYYVVRILYVIAVSTNGTELLIRNEILMHLVNLFKEITVESVQSKQNAVNYHYLVKIESKDLVRNTRIYLVYILYILTSDPQIVMMINAEYPELFGYLLEILGDSNYSQISLVLLETISQIVPFFSVQSVQDCENAFLIANKINDVFDITTHNFPNSKRKIVIASITSILRHLSRFGGSLIKVLNQHKTLDFLFNLQSSASKDLHDWISARVRVTLNALYGTSLEGVSSLSLHHLFSLLNSQSDYAVFHSLNEIYKRVEGVVKDLSYCFSNKKINKRLITSVSSSFRRSLSSISVLSINQEEEQVFDNDFLFVPNHYSQNRGGELNQILVSTQLSETANATTAIKRVGVPIRNSYQSHSTLGQINEDEEIDMTDFNEITNSISLLNRILTDCGTGEYSDLRFPICILCSSILMKYCSSPQLCNMIWDEHLIYTVITLLGSMDKTHFNDPDCIYSLGCFLISFFMHFQGDISNFWSLKERGDGLTLRVLLRLLTRPLSNDITGTFIFLFAVLLRCNSLQEEFLNKNGLAIVSNAFTKENNFIMEGTAYLLGLLGQDETMRVEILDSWSNLPSVLCDLNDLSEDVIAAFLFALESYVLTDLVKSMVISNESSILSYLILFERGCHLDGSYGVLDLVHKRASILLNYLFICNDESKCIEDISTPLLLSVLSTNVPLAVNCCLKLLNDRLSCGGPPCKEFTFIPLKTDMLDCKSSSRRSTWVPYEAVLQYNRLLLYSPGSSHCAKCFSLDDVEITQNPSDAPVNSIKLTNKRLSDSSKTIRFYNSEDASSWQMYLYSIINARSPLHSIKECVTLSESQNQPSLIDFTSIQSPVETHVWTNATIIQPSEISEETVKTIIYLTKSDCLFTAFQAMRALSIILTSANHSISHSTWQLFIDTLNSNTHPTMSLSDTDFLMKQCFYKVKKGYWICPICLNSNCSYLEVCDCCNGPHYVSLVSQETQPDISYSYLYHAYKKYLLICLLVISYNSEFCKELGVKEIRLALDSMTQDPFLVVVGSRLICNILSTVHRGYDSEIVTFLQNDCIYSVIRSVLSQLTTSHQTVFIMNALVSLIRSICYYDLSIRRVFTKSNGIEITLQLFNYILPASIHENVVQFTTPLIKDLWCGDEGVDVLGSCSIHQLMELIMWSAKNEADDTQVKTSVGVNAMTILINYANENNTSLNDHQDILLKFGIPRLLILFADVISYARYSHLKYPQFRLQFCKMVLDIIFALHEKLSPNQRFNLLMNGISHILISVIRSSWMTLQIRCISIRVLMVLMGQNVNAINAMIKKEPQFISSIFCYLNDRFNFTSLTSPITQDDMKELYMIFPVFIQLSSVGAAVLQMLKGNILFYITLFIKSSFKDLQILAVQLLWNLLLKKSSFLGSGIIQTFVIGSLYSELCSLVHRTMLNAPDESRSQRICLLTINCVIHLSFSFQRKLLITESFIADLLKLKDNITLRIRDLDYNLKYTCVDAIEMLISNNRDGSSFIHSFSSETLFQLLLIDNSFIQFTALAELFSRLTLSVRPSMELLPLTYRNTEITVSRDHVVNARGYLSPSCIYLYSSVKSVILCERLDYREMIVNCQGKEMTLIPYSTLNLKQDKIQLVFKTEDLCKEWYEVMMKNNIRGIPSMKLMIEQMEDCYKAYRNRGVFAVYQNSKTITHPMLSMVKDDRYHELLATIDIRSKSTNQQIRECCKSIVYTLKLIRNELTGEEARKWIEFCDNGGSIEISGINNWSLEMPPPPAPVPHFSSNFDHFYVFSILLIIKTSVCSVINNKTPTEKRTIIRMILCFILVLSVAATNALRVSELSYTPFLQLDICGYWESYCLEDNRMLVSLKGIGHKGFNVTQMEVTMKQYDKESCDENNRLSAIRYVVDVASTPYHYSNGVDVDVRFSKVSIALWKMTFDGSSLICSQKIEFGKFYDVTELKGCTLDGEDPFSYLSSMIGEVDDMILQLNSQGWLGFDDDFYLFRKSDDGCIVNESPDKNDSSLLVVVIIIMIVAIITLVVVVVIMVMLLMNRKKTLPVVKAPTQSKPIVQYSQPVQNKPVVQSIPPVQNKPVVQSIPPVQNKPVVLPTIIPKNTTSV